MLLHLFACGLGGEPADTDPVADSPVDTEPDVAECAADAGADDPCCRDNARIPVGVCLANLNTSVDAVGIVEDWGTPLPRFVTDEGAAYVMFVQGTPDRLLDLGAAGRIRVRDRMQCTEDYDGWTYISTEGEPSLPLVFSGSLEAEVEGWSVTSVLDHEPCPSRRADCCFAVNRVHPVRFAHGGASVDLWPGDEALLDGALVRLESAMEGSGGGDCEDCKSHRLSWYIVPAPRPP